MVMIMVVTVVNSQRAGFAEEHMARAVMLPVMNIAITPEHSAVTLFDGGATCSLIRNDFAKLLGLALYLVNLVMLSCPHLVLRPLEKVTVFY